MAVEKPVSKRRGPFSDLPNIEEVDGKYKEVILSLPKGEWWDKSTMRNYNGFWQFENFLPGVLRMQEAFQPRPDDVIVTSFMKSGTTWLKALTFTIVNRNKYAFSSHPLLQLNPHDCVPFMELKYAKGDDHYLDTLPSPRVLGTHVPYSILPDSIKTSNCPIVYIYRDPKDVFVSLWHMVTRLEWFDIAIPFTRAFELFCEGQVAGGPVWDHVLEFYTKYKQNPNKILLLKYEDMMKDPIDGVKGMANFIGCPFSEEEVKHGVIEQIVELCSFNKLKNLDVNKNGTSTLKNSTFFRKAVVGDWQNHLTAEMATKLDNIFKDKFLHSGFTF